MLLQFEGSDNPRYAFASRSASSGVAAKNARPFNVPLRWEHAIRDEDGSPPVPDLLNVEMDPDGIIVSTEGEQAAGAHLSAAL